MPSASLGEFNRIAGAPASLSRRNPARHFKRIEMQHSPVRVRSASRSPPPHIRKVAQNRAVTAAFRRYDSVSVCGTGHGSVHFGSLSPGHQGSAVPGSSGRIVHSLERRTSSKRAPTRAARLRCADTSRPKAPSRPARSPISRLIRRMTKRFIPRSISSAASRRTRPTRRTPRRRSRTRSRYRPRNTGGPKAIEACSDRLPYPRSSQQTLFGASFDYRDGH